MLTHSALSRAETSEHDLLSTFRTATRELHRRVEAHLQPPGQWTRGRYAAMLEAFHEVIAPVESRVGAWLGDLFVAPPLPRDQR